MLGGTARHPLAPQPKRAALERAAHERDDTAFTQPELQRNRFERGPVLPRHFNDAGEVLVRERRVRGGTPFKGRGGQGGRQGDGPGRMVGEHGDGGALHRKCAAPAVLNPGRRQRAAGRPITHRRRGRIMNCYYLYS